MLTLACVETRACFQYIVCFVISEICVIVPAILILGSSPRVVIECTGIHRAVQRTYSSCTLLVRTGSTHTYLVWTDPVVVLAVHI